MTDVGAAHGRDSVRRALPALAVFLSACASLPPPVPESAECRAAYLDFEQRVAQADKRNGGAHRVDGFPYLRSNRFLASFADEAPDGPQFGAWVERMRLLDLESRASELRNLGWQDPAEELAHLDRCGKAWAERDLADAARRAALRERASVPDDYSLLKRALGLYPLVVPFLNLGINNFNEDVQEDYATPYALLKSGGRLVLWSPAAPVGAPSGATAVGAAHGRDFPGRDALDIPVLSAEQWQALAAAHAPHWLVETASDADRLGAPVLRKGEPALDLSRPVTYFLPSYTRFGDRVLVQLVYVTWFSERPKEGLVDFYGGTLDGIIWRVTLDADGAPLLYDTVHPCGCYHYYFLAKPLQRREQDSFWQEPVLFPQEAPAEPFAIRVQAGTHYVRRLVPLSEVSASEVATYAQAGYDELLSLPDGEGSRSLFCEDGIACGTERLERTWLWPAGIESAGAMRQWGRHATSFVGRTHFDEPTMMDRLFEAEPSLR